MLKNNYFKWSLAGFILAGLVAGSSITQAARVGNGVGVGVGGVGRVGAAPRAGVYLNNGVRYRYRNGGRYYNYYNNGVYYNQCKWVSGKKICW